jgi:hypothetical protein
MFLKFFQLFQKLNPALFCRLHNLVGALIFANAFLKFYSIYFQTIVMDKKAIL